MNETTWLVTIVVSVFFPALALYRKLRPTKALSMRTETVPITEIEIPGMSVQWHGAQLKKPTLLHIHVTCDGASDVQPAAFDGGTVSVHTSGGAALSQFGLSPDTAIWEIEDLDPGFRVALLPLLLKSGEACSLSVLCDGDLGDIGRAIRLADVASEPQASRTQGMVDAFGLVLSGIAIGIALAVVVLIADLLPLDLIPVNSETGDPMIDAPSWSIWTPLGLGTLIGVMMGAMSWLSRPGSGPIADSINKMRAKMGSGPDR